MKAHSVFACLLLAGCSSAPDTASSELPLAADSTSIVRKVMVVSFDPILKTKGNVRLSAYEKWLDPIGETKDVAAWWQATTHGRVRFEIVNTVTVDTFPKKADGYTYNEIRYLGALENETIAHMPDDADYLAILQSQKVCEAVNAGEIDELWMNGGPYFGFNESRLAGPSAFEYNGPVLEGTSCNKLLPIMGFNYQAVFANAIHDFGHRTEATLAHHFGGWDENALANDWDRFALTASQSPSYGFSGCGTTHRPPTARDEYQYDVAAPARSMCDSFATYPDLSPITRSLAPITCSAWGCTDIGYYRWWFQRLPGKPGVTSDGHKTDWLRMAMDPTYAL